MKKIINILIITIISSTFVYSGGHGTDANMFGHVINKSNNKHIPFVNIFIEGTKIGISTDATGHYFIKNLPLGEYTIVVSAIGFKSVKQQVKFEKGKTIEVNIHLEEDMVLLEGVVVSATRNETNRKDAPSIVNVISPRIFEMTNSVCLAQGLNFQPGLRVESNCQNCGFQQVRINGLEGPYTQILIDSRPIFSSLAGVYGIEQIPANMIERVEVVRGGGSALFGSNAIAGTINIITKEPKSNSISISNTTNFINLDKPDIITSFNASVVSDNFKTGMVIFGSTRQREPVDFNDDGFSEIGLIRANNVGFRAYHRLTNNSKLTFEYHNLSEFRRGGNKFNKRAHESDITEQTEHNINTGGIQYELLSKNNKHKTTIYSGGQKIYRESYYGAQQDLNAYGTTWDESFSLGAQHTYKIDTLIFMPSELTFGTEYLYNDLTDEMLGYDKIIAQTVNTKSAYLQNEWKNKKYSFLIGTRLDKHNLVKNPILSPRVNFRYSPKESVIFRGSYSSGFRAPQAFDEDLHVTAVNGGVSLIKIDPDLKTEKSNSMSASADFYKNFGSVQTNLLVEGFYTHLDNVFVLEKIGDDNQGNIILERRNGNGAVVRGVNIEGKIVPNNKMYIQAGITIQRSNYTEEEEWTDNENVEPQSRMFRSPNTYGFITYNYNAFKDFNISIFGTYTGSMLVQHFEGFIEEDAEKLTPDFFDLSLKLSHEIKINHSAKLQFNTGIQNIFNSFQKDFDKGEFRDAGYMYGPSLPRTVFFGVKLFI